MNQIEQKYINSREVAEMVGKNHKELLRDIKRYSEQLGERNLAPSDFWRESTYKNSQNKEQPCYLVAKKGCEFIAHKLTGAKGTEFTAKYINRFHEMEDVIQNTIPKGNELIALAVIEAQKMLAEKDKEILELNSVIDEMTPKVNYLDLILQSKSTVTTTQIAQDYGLSAKKFNEKLHDMRIQHKVNKQWILYADYQGKGYVHSKTTEIVRKSGVKDVVMNTEWTQKGRIFLYNRLKNDGVYPLIEKGETAKKERRKHDKDNRLR